MKTCVQALTISETQLKQEVTDEIEGELGRSSRRILGGVAVFSAYEVCDLVGCGHTTTSGLFGSSDGVHVYLIQMRRHFNARE